MKILLIEDHPYKLGQLLTFFEENFPKITVITRGSYNSGLKEIICNHSSYEIILLDISMPNYDITPGESGGDFIPLAGQLILKEMYLREIPTKVAVITMYENFVDGTPLKMLNSILNQDFNDNYIGYVHFSANSNNWKVELKELLKNISL